MLYCGHRQENQNGSQKGEAIMYELKWVGGHIEVYRGGEFCFSADTRAEAEREIEEMAA